MRQSPEPRSIWSVEAELGEGPVWVERDQALWFTDIKRRKVHRYDPATDVRRSWDAPEQVGFVLPASDGSFIAGLQSGLYRFDSEAGTFTLIAAVEPDQPGNRLNDGVVDAAGRLWFGTMDDGERKGSGAFYCFANGRVMPTGISGVAITNGPAVSPDGRTLYWVDTLARTISACDVAADGALGDSRPFATIDAESGYPDGPTVDSEGCVWISLYAGWEVRRYAPDGKLLKRVRFPVANITKIAFGGADLRSGFATTARQLMSADEIARQPDIGNLFMFDPGVRGMPCPLVSV